MGNFLLTVNCPKIQHDLSLCRLFKSCCICIFIHHRPDLVQRLNGLAETTMDTEDLAVNDSGEGEVAKDLRPPHLQKINLYLTLCFEDSVKHEV